MLATIFAGKALVPVTILCLTGIAGLVQYNRKDKSRGMTANEVKVFDGLMNGMSDPLKIRAMAEAFEQEGFKEEAGMLRKRALLRELPPEEKAKRKEIYRKAMRSTKIEGLQALAEAYHDEGCLGSEASIRKRIAGLVPIAA